MESKSADNRQRFEEFNTKKVSERDAAEAKKVYDKSLEANREVGTGPILMQRT